MPGMTTGREFALREYSYGVLVPDKNHPLSCVSVSNSSLSIDLWVGCAWQCRYCHVQGTNQDLAEQGTMPRRPRLRTAFTIGQIVDALVEHPFFVADVSVISIGTASTEPFAPAIVDSTFDIMNEFVRRGLRNPFWIVTKGGIPKGRKVDFARIVSASRGLMISLCWAGNPKEIEPMRNNRFLNVEEAKEAGATIAWYLRPIVPEWSGSSEHIDMMMLWVKQHYSGIIDMIVPGGLRWTEGIENGLVEIHKLAMPDISRGDNEKSLPQELVDSIFALSGQYFPGVPVYLKSSCALTHMLKIPSITSVHAFARAECEASRCPAEQRRICAKGAAYDMTVEKAQDILRRLGVPARVLGWDGTGGLITSPALSEFAYAIRQTIFKSLAEGGAA
ncbi:MAG: hypothetical protein AAB384_00430 [Patescibacteria group bacterium]